MNILADLKYHLLLLICGFKFSSAFLQYLFWYLDDLRPAIPEIADHQFPPVIANFEA